jgi:UDP-N-acetylmuramoyl-L-alanyl-D-glutamate--2,6-diaminopimelate ligase
VRTLTNLPAHQKQVCAVINIDEPAGQYLAAKGPMEVKLTYGMGEKAEVRATNIHMGPKKSAFHMTLGGENFNCKLPIVGRHNLYAVLGASGAALALDIPPQTVAHALGRLPALSGVMEEVAGDKPFNVYVDGAGTPELLGQTLKSLHEITPGKIILVLGCRERTSARHRFDMGKAAGEYANLTVLTSDNSGREPASEIASVIAQGLEQKANSKYIFEEERGQAIYQALSIAMPGDAVLIAGKGDNCYQEFADTIVPFDDRECARECLERLPQPAMRDRRSATLIFN